jgi:molybdopterin-guanine dinucleotide biosynthesis protein A
MRPVDDVSAFVLAGGQSTRMGEDKAFLLLGGRSLLHRALELARSVADDVRIVDAGSGAGQKFAAYAPVLQDMYAGSGPLAGIHAALRATSTELNLMLAVDVPLVTRDFLRHLIARARESGAVVTVPRGVPGAGGRPESASTQKKSARDSSAYYHPLCAVYRRGFADVAEPALKSGANKIDALFPAVPTLVIEQEEMERLGFSPMMLRNLNTPEDFEGVAGLSWE